MKKFIISLLLICTICLGCLALTACDKYNDNSNDNTPIKLISNKPVYDYRGIPTVMYNNYEFNIYYLPEWYRSPDEDGDMYTTKIAFKLQSQDTYDSVTGIYSSTKPSDCWTSLIMKLTQSEDYIDFIAYKYSLNTETQEPEWQPAYEYRLDLKDTYIDHHPGLLN